MAYLFWAFLIFLLFLPTLKQRYLVYKRLQLLKSLEKKRKSRVVTLIHRQEFGGLLGMFLGRFVSIEDSEQILRAIRFTPKAMPIDLILHTPGGLALAAEQIAQALVKHKGEITVFIPHYALSGGTLIALAASKIVMDPNAVLGPVDPQVGGFPAASILELTKKKPKNKIEDKTLILADIAKKALRQIQDVIMELLVSRKIEKKKAQKIASDLTSGKYTHDYPISSEELASMGLNITTKMPNDIYDLIALYPQASPQRPSVQYIPFPYEERKRK